MHKASYLRMKIWGRKKMCGQYFFFLWLISWLAVANSQLFDTILQDVRLRLANPDGVYGVWVETMYEISIWKESFPSTHLPSSLIVCLTYFQTFQPTKTSTKYYTEKSINIWLLFSYFDLFNLSNFHINFSTNNFKLAWE